jgi:stearoyl-CoA desaturase (delta-9 desaturase)
VETNAKAAGRISAGERKVNAKSIPFFLVHAVALGGAFLVPFAWHWVALAAGLYALRMFAVTAGYHRYFSHRTFRTSRAFQFVLALLGSTAAQKGPLWWAAHHRVHHKFSDQEGDVHSPLREGFYWSHVGWILSDKFEETRWEKIPDLRKYPELRWLNRWHLVPPTALAVLLALVGGPSALIWGFFVSTVVLWHCTFFINSLAHVFGKRRYPTTDTSRNSFLLALLTLGEGWHNNHHYYMTTANQGWFWWELDVSYYLLRLLSAFGLVWDLATPPRKIRDGAIAVAPPAPSRLPIGAAGMSPRVADSVR